MKSKWILLVVGILTIIIVLGLSCILSLVYERRSVLTLPSEESLLIPLSDSLTVRPYFYIDGNSRLGASFRFDHVSDSIFLSYLDVSVTSIDNPGQVISLTHILTYKDSIDWSYENDYRVTAHTYSDFPIHYKTISRFRELNSFIFYFETQDMDRSVNYKLKIAGTAIYHGQTLFFSKVIYGRRERKWLPVQMMT